MQGMVISREFNKNKKKKKCDHWNHKIKSWSDLHDDIVTLIMEQLCYSDQIRCRAVCRGWKSNIDYGLKYDDKELPWVFSYRHKRSTQRKKNECYLYDPSHKTKYRIDFKHTNIDLEDAQVVASNYGWLIFLLHFDSDSDPHRPVLFLYNPFADKIMRVPKLSSDFMSKKILISASPASPDCLIFAVGYFLNKFCISTCRPGDTTWTLNLSLFPYGDILDATSLNGVVYCVFLEGLLVAFKYATKEWKIHQTHGSLHNIGLAVRRNLNSTSDGKLLLVDFDYLGGCHGLQLNWNQMKWFEVECFGNKALFVDYTYSFAWESCDPELADTVHDSNGRDGIRAYSINKSKERRTCPTQSPYSWMKKKLNMMNIWVQPPQIN